MNEKGNLIVVVILILAAIGVVVYFSYLYTDNEGLQDELGFNGSVEEIGEKLGDIVSVPQVSNTSERSTVTAPKEEIILAPTADNVVFYTNKGFIPSSVEIEQGKPLVFVNKSDLALRIDTEDLHNGSTEYIGFGNSPTLSYGEEWSSLLHVVGTISYKNVFNNGHLGEVVVTPQE